MSGRINLSNLSDSLKEHLNGLGLSEEQVNELIENALVEINEKNVEQDEVVNGLVDKVGELNGLMTEEKGDLVGAINELFQSANNGKQLIANAIGEPLNAEDTFSAMSDDINGLLSTFKTNMMNNGITVESSDRFKSLIDKIATMVEEGSGKGIQYAEGKFLPSDYDTEYGEMDINGISYSINTNLSFTPTFIIMHIPYGGAFVQTNFNIKNAKNIYVTNLYPTIFGGNGGYAQTEINIINITAESFTISCTSTRTEELPLGLFNEDGINWYAIGVGEEDTTLRDSLASILEEEGVSVTEEDDMASLISKVDSEFDNKNNEIENNKGYKIVPGDEFSHSSATVSADLYDTTITNPRTLYVHTLQPSRKGVYKLYSSGVSISFSLAEYSYIKIGYQICESSNVIETAYLVQKTTETSNEYNSGTLQATISLSETQYVRFFVELGELTYVFAPKISYTFSTASLRFSLE